MFFFYILANATVPLLELIHLIHTVDFWDRGTCLYFMDENTEVQRG